MKVKYFILSTLLLISADRTFADNSETQVEIAQRNLANAAQKTASVIKDEDQTLFHLPRNENKGLMKGGNISTGLALVTVNSADVRGRFFKSLELFVKFGDDGKCSAKESKEASKESKDGEKNQSSKYHCVKQQYSTQSENLFYALRDLDSSQPVIIKYKKQLLPNPFTRATRYNITDFYPTYIGMDPRKAGIPEFFKDSNNIANTNIPAKLQGRMIDVKRWGRFSTGCVLTLQLPGSRKEDRTFGPDNLEPNVGVGLTFGPGAFPIIPIGAKPNVGVAFKKKTVDVLNYAKIKLASDEACRYAEDLIPFAHPVEIRYSQAYSEFFDYSRAVASIHLL